MVQDRAVASLPFDGRAADSSRLSAARPRPHVIDHRTIKLLVGVIAVSIAPLCSLLARATQAAPITSVSESYYVNAWSQSVFVGFLFAIGALLLSYNGYSAPEMVLSKLAAVAALLVALFPCQCGTHPQIVPGLHGDAADVMFVILAYFCYGFYQRARAKGHLQANVRATIYAICGLAILLAIAVVAFDSASRGALSERVPRTVFYGETLGLVAFGISWLTASRVLPGITRKDERFSLLRADNPA